MPVRKPLLVWAIFGAVLVLILAVAAVLYYNLPSYDRLMAAIQRGQVEAVKREIALGVDVNRARDVVHRARQEYGMGQVVETGVTPLHDAATCGEPAIIGLLVEAGADPDAVAGPAGWTPLVQAVLFGDANTVLALVEVGADVDRQDRFSGPLHHAARQGKRKVAEILLNAGADVEGRTNGGRTPLMYAVRWYPAKGEGSLRVTQVLLERGARVESCDDHGWSVLMYAAEHGHPHIVQRLLDASMSHDEGRGMRDEVRTVFPSVPECLRARFAASVLRGRRFDHLRQLSSISKINPSHGV